MNCWKSEDCEANGISIHVTRTGGNKPPLVLLHGLMTDGMCCWADLARSLEEEYDVIMPDARGHGSSSAPAFGYRYEDHARDVIGLLHAFGLVRPILLGHSMGGMTAAVVASLEPSLLRGVILADPTFLSPEAQQEVYNSDVIDQHRKILGMPFDEVVADARRRHPDRSDETNMLFARARLQTSMAAFDVLRPPNPDYRKLASAIDVPGLIVFGDRGVVSLAVAEGLQRLNPRLHVEQIQGAGHSVHRDQPKRFAETVVSFMHSL